jgi:SAM-dependent methyltransferase
MPCYNELGTIKAVLERVLESPYTSEVVIVDDCSTDGTREILEGLDDSRVRVLYQPVNQGKGAALRRGFKAATAPYVIVQDADLEYDPADYASVLQPLLDGQADVVYGSRFHSSRPHRVLYYWHSLGNRFLTTLSNMFTNLNLSDMETCYKAFRREVLQAFEIEEDRFGFEPEITAKLAGAGFRIYEVGISYAGRTYAEGKKIGWRDGVRAFYCIVRYSPLLQRRRAAAFRERRPADLVEADGELAETLHNLDGADNYADWIHSLLAPHLGARVLEVGAGHGILTGRMAESAEVTATDISPRCAAVLRQRYDAHPNVRVLEGDIAAATAVNGGKGYDSAVVVNVLEHIEDDDQALRALAEGVRPGGAVLLWVPAFEFLYSRFDKEVGHFRRYTRRDLVSKARRAGLEPVAVRYVNSVGALGWWLVAKRLGRRPTEGWSVRAYDKAVIPLLRRYEPEKVPFGQSLFAVLRRPTDQDRAASASSSV